MCAYIYLLFLASPEILLKYLWNTIFAKLLNILACKSLVNMNMWHKFLRNQVSYLLVGRTLIIVFLRVPPPISSLGSFESREVLGYLSIEYVTSRVGRTYRLTTNYVIACAHQTESSSAWLLAAQRLMVAMLWLSLQTAHVSIRTLHCNLEKGWFDFNVAHL